MKIIRRLYRFFKLGKTGNYIYKRVKKDKNSYIRLINYLKSHS